MPKPLFPVADLPRPGRWLVGGLLFVAVVIPAAFIQATIEAVKAFGGSDVWRMVANAALVVVLGDSKDENQ